MWSLSRAADTRLKKTLAIVLLLIVLAINGFSFFSGLKNEPELFGTMLLAINVLIIFLIFGIYFIGELVDPEKVPVVELVNSLLIAIASTGIACVWLVSLVFVFSSNGLMPDSKTYASLACYSSIAIMALFVYYAYVHQHN
jgi:hypothetical protein